MPIAVEGLMQCNEGDFFPISLFASIFIFYIAGTDIIRSYVASQLAISVSHYYWLGGGQVKGQVEH